MLLFDQGEIYLEEVGLWLDPKTRRPFSFVFHGHSDHLRSHPLVLVSERTASFYCHRFRGGQVLAQPFNQPFYLGDYRVELFPSGHILGAAQILIEGDLRVVYTGDFKLRLGKTAEPIQIKPCDVLIMECTYGLPQYIFPPREWIVEQMVQFVQQALDEGAVPVFFAYRIGKAQELIKLLGEYGFPLIVDDPIYGTAKIYEQLGVELPSYQLYDGRDLRGKVLILSPGARCQGLLRRIAHKRTAILTGWALTGGPESFGTDAAFPFSDHADFRELLEYVRTVAPRKVYVRHGLLQFCEYLRQEGFDALPLPSHVRELLRLR